MLLKHHENKNGGEWDVVKFQCDTFWHEVQTEDNHMGCKIKPGESQQMQYYSEFLFVKNDSDTFTS